MALLHTGQVGSSWRILLSYAGMAYIMVRLMFHVRVPVRAEFGRAAYLCTVVSGSLITALLVALALRQAFSMGTAQEMHADAGASFGLMTTYLLGSALFNFGFMVLLTQLLVQRLRRRSRRDALTGMDNRCAIDATMLHAWGQSERSGDRFAVCLIDVDRF
jgi:hypothetical protein